MKKILMMFYCVSFILSCFYGCANSIPGSLTDDISSDISSGEENEVTTFEIVTTGNDNENDIKKYELKTIGDKNYLIIENEFTDLSFDGCLLYPANLEFDSMETFVDTVKNGKLSDSELRIIDEVFKKDSEGRIEICDFSNLQVPVTPDGVKISKVTWSGKSYAFHIEIPEDAFGYVYMNHKTIFDRRYKEYYTEYFDNDRITLQETVEYKDFTEYYYSTKAGEFKKVRYTIENDNIKLEVDESYILAAYNDLMNKPSLDVPDSVQIFGAKDGKSFEIIIYSLETKPTVEWLSQFSIEDYKEA
jgi:hypothetical protein